MRVLLINPNREHMPWPAMPIGLCMIATALRSAGHDVELLDLTFSRDPGAEVRTSVRNAVPAWVGVTLRNLDNCNFEVPVFYPAEVRELVMAPLREAAPRVPVVIGGSAVSIAPEACLAYLGADYALAGEGECAVVELARALDEGEDPVRVPGVLAARGDGHALAASADATHQKATHAPRALVADMHDSVPSDAWRWLNIRRYASQGSPYPLLTKRGCPLSCVYCVYNKIEGRRYRKRDAEAVVEEAAAALRQHRVRRFEFVDSTFNLPQEHALAICEQFVRRRLPVELSTMGLNPAGVTPDLVSLLPRAGFRSVMCTAESGSDVTLAGLGKGYGCDAVARAARLLHGAGIRTFWYVMLGGPGETMATVRETLRFCDRHIPSSDVILFTTGIRVYPGTPLADTCREMGWFEPDDPLFEPAWFLSPEVELGELYHALVQAAAAHPNWLTNAESTLSPRAAALLKGALRVAGCKGPFWTHLPKLFTWTGRTGIRRRVLARYEHQMLTAPQKVGKR